MLGCVYMFEKTPAHGAEQAVSTLVIKAIEASINERPGIRYQELTDPSNAKPIFAVLFADLGHKALFDNLFEPALKLCGLRVSVLRGLDDKPTAKAVTEAQAETPTEARKAELGYVDRDRGYALFIPSVISPIKEA